MDFRSWCLHYFPGGTFTTSRDGENYGPIKNPYRDDSKPSLSFGTKDGGVYNDFGGRGGKIKFFVHEHGIPEVWDGAEPWVEHHKDEKILSYRGEDHVNAHQAWQMWDEGKPADDHPYLRKKGYSGEGLRVTSREYRFEKDVVTPAGTLLIPATDLYGAFQGVERIFPDLSRDKAHRGGKSRCYYGDKPEDGKPLYLVEGWATQEAVKRIAGDNKAVAEIFGLSCMTGFAKAVKERYPNIELVFCPDKPGSEEQRKIVESLKQYGVVVELPEDRDKNTDWDDELRKHGLEATKNLFREAWSKATVRQQEAPEEKWDSSSFILRRIGDLPLEEPEFLVDDLFEADALCLFFGESGCKKSFVALDLAASIVTGAPFYGKQTKEGPVIYLAGEGIGGMTKRAEAWTKHRGISLSGAPLFLSNRAALFMDERSARMVEEEVERAAQEVGNPLLIIIDTLARSIVGGDENSAKDVSKFIDRVDSFRRKYGASVLLVHHSGIVDKGRLRGSSAWKGALDAEFLIESSGPENMLVTVTCKKMKDGAIPAPFSFQVIEYVVLDGKKGPVTSLALEPTDAQPSKSERMSMSRAQKTALDTYHAAAKEMPTMDKEGNILGVHLEDWRGYFYAASTADNTEGKKKAFQRARNDLVSSNVLTVNDSIYSIVKTTNPDPVHDYAKKIRTVSDQDTGTSGQTGTLSRNVPAANYTKRDNRDIILKDVPCPGSLSRSEAEEERCISLEPAEISSPRDGHSLCELASRGGVSVEAIRESLSEWESCGRVSLDGDKIIILEGDSYPGQDETEPPEETSVTAPKDLPSSSLGQVRLFEGEPVRGEDPSSCGKVLYSPEMARVWLESQPEEVKAEYQAKLKRLKGVEMPDYENVALLRTWEQFGKTS